MIAIIPARGGSQRIKNKNIRDFHGKPIIAYSIEVAQESGLFDDIWVTSDSGDILTIAKQYGGGCMSRSAELSVDDIGTQEVVRSELNDLEVVFGIEHEYICAIYPTSPLLSVEDLKRGLQMLKTSRSLNFAYSTDLKGNDAGNFYWGTRDAFINSEPLHDNNVPAPNTIQVPLAEDRVCDINTPEDWSRAEQMFTNLRR